MPPAALFEQAALAHQNTGVPRHQRIDVLDDPVALRIGENVLVPVVGNPVELEQPVLKAVSEVVELAGTQDVRGGVPGDDGLCPGAAGGGSDAQDVEHRLLLMAFCERGDELLPAGEHLAGERDELRDLQVVGAGWRGAAGGSELECAHATSTDVAQTLNGVEALRRAPLSGEPGVDQGLTVTVGQAVGQEAGQPVDCLLYTSPS